MYWHSKGIRAVFWRMSRNISRMRRFARRSKKQGDISAHQKKRIVA
jgi:hypothetical protein